MDLIRAEYEEEDWDLEDARAAAAAALNPRGPPSPPRPLPVPVVVKEMYKTDQLFEKENDLLDHQGRSRTFPHEKGNWVGFTYIPVPLAAERMFRRIMDMVRETMQKHPYFDCTLNEIDLSSVHLSLSHTHILRHPWIEDISATLNKKFKTVPQFMLEPYELDFFENDDCTKTFLVLKARCRDALDDLVRQSDATFGSYGLRYYYRCIDAIDRPYFHFSIGWGVGNWVAHPNTIELKNLVGIMNDKLKRMIEVLSVEPFKVECVEFKTGNIRHRYFLPKYIQNPFKTRHGR